MLAHEIHDYLEKPDRLLTRLSKLFDHLLEEYSFFEFSSMKADIVKKSHSKKILLQEQTPHGLFVFEAIIFNPGIFTGPHTHSEYFIEKIVSGEIEERQYRREGNQYLLADTVTRSSDEPKREINCPDLFPHNVKAIHGQTHSFCLSFGQSPIQAINAR